MTNKTFSTFDYYPFGMIMPGRSYTATSSYRFGFNGKEKNNEIEGEGNNYDFGARIYDSRLGRWLTCDPMTSSYPSHSGYAFGLDNPIYFIDRNGKYIVDPDGNIIKFKVKKNGQVKFKSHVDAFSRKVIESMAALESSRKVLLDVRDNKDVKVQYKKISNEMNSYYEDKFQIKLSGVTVSKEEYDLVNQKLDNTITPEKFKAEMKKLAQKQYIRDGSDPDGHMYTKNMEVFNNQVVLINEDNINKAKDPNKEFLLTVTEESFHTQQDYFEQPTYPLDQEKYEDLKQEKRAHVFLKTVEKEYDEKNKPKGNNDSDKHP